MNTDLLGRWYALEPVRYYGDAKKPINYYKLYITKVEETKCWYDSFILYDDDTMKPLKVDKETSIHTVRGEIEMGYLMRARPELRPALNEIGQRYGLNINMQISS